ncbi:MAG: hypothetical protein EPN93_17310 [Spirochaetes bacterium]|nr:MAG: hypothetical protein EPN93_17310 [Spirochaetota bacterium]
MKTINISKDKEYQTQRDNPTDPHGTCNTTASINALLSSGIRFNYPFGMQPEEHLTRFMESPESWEKMRKEYPWAVTQGYHPRHVHDMLAWGVNRLVGRTADIFRVDASIQEILFNIAAAQCAVNVCGRFTSYGHIVTVVGFTSEQDDVDACQEPGDIDLPRVIKIIIDDPYGNYFSKYQNPDGNNVYFPVADFNFLTREYGDHSKKWAHFFVRG